MSVEADSRIGAWLYGVSAPRMPWLTAATRHGCGVNLHEDRFKLVWGVAIMIAGRKLLLR